jgi:hypothetical protein
VKNEPPDRISKESNMREVKKMPTPERCFETVMPDVLDVVW